MTMLPPPEKLDMQTVDTQCRLLFQFLTSLLRFRSGWFANHALQRTAAPLGSRTVQVIWQRLLQPTGRFRRRSLSLGR